MAFRNANETQIISNAISHRLKPCSNPQGPKTQELRAPATSATVVIEKIILPLFKWHMIQQLQQR